MFHVKTRPRTDTRPHQAHTLSTHSCFHHFRYTSQSVFSRYNSSCHRGGYCNSNSCCRPVIESSRPIKPSADFETEVVTDHVILYSLPTPPPPQSHKSYILIHYPHRCTLFFVRVTNPKWDKKKCHQQILLSSKIILSVIMRIS